MDGGGVGAGVGAGVSAVGADEVAERSGDDGVLDRVDGKSDPHGVAVSGVGPAGMGLPA